MLGLYAHDEISMLDNRPVRITPGVLLQSVWRSAAEHAGLLRCARVRRACLRIFRRYRLVAAPAPRSISWNSALGEGASPSSRSGPGLSLPRADSERAHGRWRATHSCYRQSGAAARRGQRHRCRPALRRQAARRLDYYFYNSTATSSTRFRSHRPRSRRRAVLLFSWSIPRAEIHVEINGQYAFAQNWLVRGSFAYTCGVNETNNTFLNPRSPPVQGIVAIAGGTDTWGGEAPTPSFTLLARRRRGEGRPGTNAGSRTRLRDLQRLGLVAPDAADRRP